MTESQIASLEQQQQASTNEQHTAFTPIKDDLAETNRLIAFGNTITSNIADTLRLDWLRQLGGELKTYMTRIYAMNIATYHAVISIQSAWPIQLERGLIEEPVIFEDGIGRVAPVHLQFITSWEPLKAVLEIRFRDHQGFKKVKHGFWGCRDSRTHRAVGGSWERVFRPGQRVEMIFYFHASEGKDQIDPTICPSCRAVSADPVDAEIVCRQCELRFQRVSIVRRISKKEEREEESGGQAILASSDAVIENEEDDMRDFKRVRLVSTSDTIDFPSQKPLTSENHSRSAPATDWCWSPSYGDYYRYHFNPSTQSKSSMPKAPPMKLIG